VVHIDDVLVSGSVTVILLDDLVHEGGEIVVRLVGTSIDTNTGVSPLGTREDSLLESETILVLAVLALFPDIAGEALVEKRLGTGGEVGEALNVLRGVKVRTHHGAVEFGFGVVVGDLIAH
jgi:hypothetical protein